MCVCFGCPFCGSLFGKFVCEYEYVKCVRIWDGNGRLFLEGAPSFSSDFHDPQEPELILKPMSGTIDPQSELPIEIIFAPKHEKSFNFNVACNVSVFFAIFSHISSRAMRECDIRNSESLFAICVCLYAYVVFFVIIPRGCLGWGLFFLCTHMCILRKHVFGCIYTYVCDGVPAGGGVFFFYVMACR